MQNELINAFKDDEPYRRAVTSYTTSVATLREELAVAARELVENFKLRRDLLHEAALAAQLREELAQIYPVPFDPAVSTSARAMAERRMNTCTDTEAPGVAEHIRKAGRAAGFRSNTVVPLVRDDEGIGTIVLTYPDPGYSLSEKARRHPTCCSRTDPCTSRHL